MNLECENGIEVAGFEIADHVLARIGWLLPLLTVSISMLIHALSGNARSSALLHIRSRFRTLSDGYSRQDSPSVVVFFVSSHIAFDICSKVQRNRNECSFHFIQE